MLPPPATHAPEAPPRVRSFSERMPSIHSCLSQQNPENLTKTQSARLEGMGPLKLNAAKAYPMRPTLQDLYPGANDRQAHRRLRAWVHPF